MTEPPCRAPHRTRLGNDFQQRRVITGLLRSGIQPRSSSVEAFPLNTTGGSVGRELERVCVENELVITAWSPVHLRTKLKELYWKEGQPAAGAMAFWEDALRYLYLPRLKDRDILVQAIQKGATSRDFFGTAYGQHDGQFDGFQFGHGDVQLDDTLLLIEPDAAKQYEADHNNGAKEHIKRAVSENAKNLGLNLNPA